ncbi:NAD-dependent epimerase/dehydratase family protein [Zobellia galactanivorans]|uniref:NAD-dependent epimerase/dehydratase family protein n=1 Tax=Zobellia galactanivorans (strain DSM 12802 / CCUG 47099 / CIP 106680 / NCIMB 13871 / Dsij) TaxID=63186 RepID=UPI001C06540C|nr:NAD-dependent epimerase/dehydratase family protein [Zobellia galactanivorans]MBU3027228.1 NAD-dependent epimerase/dehydratase family protein [Zobellia galactanivorans]MDO6807841.1 NAD-dependent epimerase/dehydratase family protein [Zobellia galactanivorans]
MKILFIGGTGNISTASSRLALEKGIDLYHLNRGTKKGGLTGVQTIYGDINKPEELSELQKHSWDVVVNWIAFTPEDIERDITLFHGKTKQYIFISSASCYQTPLQYPIITESTPLCNNLWDYSQNKIRCEDRLIQAYREKGFPVTIVRPSLTYDTVIPIAIGGFREYTTADRIIKGKEIIVHGDGTSLWTVTHADDFAKGFVGLLGLTTAIGHAFHITSDEILSWNMIYRIFADALGFEARVVHIASDFICKIEPSFTGTLLADKGESVIFDNSKIKTFVPGFKATIPFSEGIKRTLKWFDENPEHKIVNEDKNRQIERILQAYKSL